LSEISKRGGTFTRDRAAKGDETLRFGEALELELQLVNAELFSPYGDLVQASDPHPLSVNAGTALRHDIAVFDRDERPGSRLVTSVFETLPQALPLVIGMLEQHPFSRQAIVEMRGLDFILAVCVPKANGQPDLASLRAFLFPHGFGVIYRKGVWHTPIIGIAKVGQFFVQSWQDGTAADCEEASIPPHIIRPSPLAKTGA
jgi:ureidoglycolate lyase